MAAEPEEALRDEASGFATYLSFLRESIAEAVLALSTEEQRTTRLASGWTPIELLSHVLHMERRWFVWGFLGESVAEPWGDWNVDEPWDEGVEGRWQVAEDATAEAYADRLEAIGERTRDVLASYPLDAVGSTEGRFAEDPPTLEWICFHVLAEYARHAGHLDVVVELGDG